MQKKSILFVLIGLGALIVSVGAGFGIKYLIDAMQPHRQPLAVAADKNKQTYNSSGVAANPSDDKGSWVKLSQDWRVGLDQGALVNYAIASDGTRAFLSISSFSNKSKSELRAYD